MKDDRLNEDQALDRGLTADLAALRETLRAVRAPDSAERELSAALQARRAFAATVEVAHETADSAEAVENDALPGAAPRRHAAYARAWRAPFAFAAAASLAAVAAVFTLGVDRGDGVVPPLPTGSVASVAAAPVAAATQVFTGAFQPLAFSPGVSPSQSYSVVRVRIPLNALAPGQSAPPDATLEADLLVGEDGLASGIRFNRADTLFVSAVSGEQR